MVNLLCVHQDEMNENEGGNVQTTSAQSLVHSPHANLSKYGHVTTRAETIIRTNRLVGYQSTSRRQYYKIS